MTLTSSIFETNANVEELSSETKGSMVELRHNLSDLDNNINSKVDKQTSNLVILSVIDVPLLIAAAPMLFPAMRNAQSAIRRRQSSDQWAQWLWLGNDSVSNAKRRDNAWSFSFLQRSNENQIRSTPGCGALGKQGKRKSRGR